MAASGEPSSSSDGPSRPLPELKVHQFVYLTNPLSASVGRKRLKSSHWRSRDAFIGRVEELIDEDNVRVRWMYRPADIPASAARHWVDKGALFNKSFSGGSPEVVWSDHLDVNSVQSIEGRCEVLPLPEYERLAKGGGSSAAAARDRKVRRKVLDSSKSARASSGSTTSPEARADSSAKKDESTEEEEDLVPDTFFYNLAYNTTIDCLFPIAEVDLKTCFPKLVRPGSSAVFAPTAAKEHESTVSWKRMKQQMERLVDEERLTRDEANQLLMLEHRDIEKLEGLCGDAGKDSNLDAFARVAKDALNRASKLAWTTLNTAEEGGGGAAAAASEHPSDTILPSELFGDLLVEGHDEGSYLVSLTIAGSKYRGWLSDVFSSSKRVLEE